MHRSSLPRLRTTLAAFFLLSFAALVGTPTSSAAVLNRITQTVSGSSPVEVPDSVHPKVALATDLGPTAAETRLVGLTIRFNMTQAQQAALDQLLADLQDPTSPRYHQWLTPTEFGAQFGLSSDDLAKVTTWLTSQGFTVTGVANGGTFVTFDGTVAQAEAAFSTSIHNLSVDGETHYANLSNPSVPGAFAGVVGAITGLHNFRAKPQLRSSLVKPQYTSSISESHYLAPGDIYTIYDVNPLLNAGLNGGGIGAGTNCHSTPTGSPCGDIAVTGAVDLYNTGTASAPVYTDIIAFRAASGLSAASLTTIHEGGDPGNANNCDPNVAADCPFSPNIGDLRESSIDLEWSGAMAPSATLLFVNGPDPFDNALTGAIDLDFAPFDTTRSGGC
jgi:subtilase family serine protease